MASQHIYLQMRKRSGLLCSKHPRSTHAVDAPHSLALHNYQTNECAMLTQVNSTTCTLKRTVLQRSRSQAMVGKIRSSFTRGWSCLHVAPVPCGAGGSKHSRATRAPAETAAAQANSAEQLCQDEPRRGSEQNARSAITPETAAPVTKTSVQGLTPREGREYSNSITPILSSHRRWLPWMMRAEEIPAQAGGARTPDRGKRLKFLGTHEWHRAQSQPC